MNPSRSVLSALLAQCIAASALAAQAGKPEDGAFSGSDYFAQLGGGLVLVILSIVALAWLLKRLNRLPGRGDQQLEVLSAVSVGQRERVVLLRAADRHLLLGVAPGSVRRLDVLDTQVTEATGSAPNQFRTLLRRSRTESGPEPEREA